MLYFGDEGKVVGGREGDSDQYISLADQLLVPLSHCSSSGAYKDYITDETLAAYTYLLRHSTPCGQFAVLFLIKCTIVSCLCAK